MQFPIVKYALNLDLSLPFLPQGSGYVYVVHLWKVCFASTSLPLPIPSHYLPVSQLSPDRSLYRRPAKHEGGCSQMGSQAAK